MSDTIESLKVLAYATLTPCKGKKCGCGYDDCPCCLERCLCYRPGRIPGDSEQQRKELTSALVREMNDRLQDYFKQGSPQVHFTVRPNGCPLSQTVSHSLWHLFTGYALGKSENIFSVLIFLFDGRFRLVAEEMSKTWSDDSEIQILRYLLNWMTRSLSKRQIQGLLDGRTYSCSSGIMTISITPIDHSEETLLAQYAARFVDRMPEFNSPRRKARDRSSRPVCPSSRKANARNANPKPAPVDVTVRVLADVLTW